MADPGSLAINEAASNKLHSLTRFPRRSCSPGLVPLALAGTRKRNYMFRSKEFKLRPMEIFQKPCNLKTKRECDKGEEAL